MNICVYCGSSRGNDEEILHHAGRLGRQMARNGHRLIYGGASVGVMGTLADAVMQHGGETIFTVAETPQECLVQCMKR